MKMTTMLMTMTMMMEKVEIRLSGAIRSFSGNGKGAKSTDAKRGHGAKAVDQAKGSKQG